jgi:hypothetical protein
MKRLFLKTLILFVAILPATTSFSQSSCSNYAWLDEYLFDGQYMTETFSTVGVPNDNASANPPVCGTFVGTGGQHWYRFQLANQIPITVTISTDHAITNFDTQLHVYTGSCGSLTCVAGDDDSGTGTTSIVTFTAQPGVTYRVRVGGFGTAEGITNIRMFAGDPGCTDPSAQNYNWESVWDNGTCCYNGYAVLNISNSGGQPYENTATIRVNGVDLLTIHPGWTYGICTPESCNFDLVFYDDNGGTWGGTTYSLWINGQNYTGTVPNAGSFGLSVVQVPVCGCTNWGASNWDPNAIYDDGSCCYNGSISLSSDATPGSFLTFTTGGLTYYVSPGQTSDFCSGSICNSYITTVSPAGTTATGTYTVSHFGDSYNGSIQEGANSYIAESPLCGCTEYGALNFSSGSFYDDGTCYYTENAVCAGAMEIFPNNVYPVSTEGIPAILNTTSTCFHLRNSPTAWFKFVYEGGSVKFSTLHDHDTVLGVFDDCEGEPIVCMDDIVYTFENGSGIMETSATVNLSCEDGLIKGNTYYLAVGKLSNAGTFYLNFEQFHNPGCTDPYALNYDACASLEDNSCVYPETCPADLDNSNFVNITDLLMFISFYGSNCGLSENAN